MKLCEALRVQQGEIISIVGAGGKTTAMYRLSRELAELGWRVIVTTTTMLRPPASSQADAVVVESVVDKMLLQLREALQHGRVVFLASERLTTVNKLRGVAPERLTDLAELADAVLVEADGARGLSLKAPAWHEPVVGRATTLLMPVVAIDAVGHQLDDRIAHRPQLLTEVTGLSPGDEITPATVAALMVHSHGGLKGVPAGCCVAPLINKVEDAQALQNARKIAAEVKGHPSLSRILIGAVARDDPISERWCRVSAVVLAAGASTRFGSPKQLVQLGAKTLLRHVLDGLRWSGVDEIVVVLGHAADRIAMHVPEWCQTVLNEGWEEGISSSIHRGLAEVDRRSEAALFVLGDQPRANSSAIKHILLAYYGSALPIVVPSHHGQSGNPVLFDRRLFPALLDLRGDVGGRQLLEVMPECVRTVEVADGDMFLDIDTPADLERYQANAEAKDSR